MRMGGRLETKVQTMVDRRGCSGRDLQSFDSVWARMDKRFIAGGCHGRVVVSLWMRNPHPESIGSSVYPVSITDDDARRLIMELTSALEGKGDSQKFWDRIAAGQASPEDIRKELGLSPIPSAHDATQPQHEGEPLVASVTLSPR